MLYDANGREIRQPSPGALSGVGGDRFYMAVSSDGYETHKTKDGGTVTLRYGRNGWPQFIAKLNADGKPEWHHNIEYEESNFGEPANLDNASADLGGPE